MKKKTIIACGLGLLLTACFEYEESRDINAVSDDGQTMSKDESDKGNIKSDQGFPKDKPGGNDGSTLPPVSDNSGASGSGPGAGSVPGEEPSPTPPPPMGMPAPEQRCLKADATLEKESKNLEIVLTHIFTAMNDRDSNFGCIENKANMHRNSRISGENSGEYAILLVRDSDNGDDDGDDNEYVRLNVSCNHQSKSLIEKMIFYTIAACETYAENSAPFCISDGTLLQKGLAANIEVKVPLSFPATTLMIDATSKADIKSFGNLDDCRLVLTRQDEEASFPAEPGD